MTTFDVAQEFPIITVKPRINKTIKYMGIPNTELCCYMKNLLSSVSCNEIIERIYNFTEGN